MSDDGRTTSDEKPTAGGKLDSLSQEGLIDLLKKQVALKKKLEARISELTASNVTLCQTEEEIRNKLDDEQQETKRLRAELEQYQINESKLQQEVTRSRESTECLQLQNESLKSSCKYLQDELTNVQANLSSLRSTTGNLEEDLTNRLADSQEQIDRLLDEKRQWEESKEKLQPINDQLTAELNDLRSRFNTLENEKQLMEEQLNQLRKELDESSSQKDVTEDLTSLLRDEQYQNVANELSDIPALLSSIGVSDNREGELQHPVDTRTLLRLCSLLIERSKVLQNSTTSSTRSVAAESFTTTEADGYEQSRLFIPRQEHAGFDAFFEQLYSSVGQSSESADWQINLVKPIDQSAEQRTRLELNNLKFVSEQVEQELLETRARLDQLSHENGQEREARQSLEQQLEGYRNEIELLKGQLHASEQSTLNQLAEHNSEQFEAERQKARDLEDAFNQDRSRYEETLEQQRLQLLERDESIRALKLNAEQSREQDEQCASLAKQVQQYCDTLETKTNENKQLKERVDQLEEGLKENKQLLFETSKQADDLDRQLQVSISQHDELKTEVDRLNDERKHLMEKMENFERDKSEYVQINDRLQQELQMSKVNHDQTVQTNKDNESLVQQLQHAIETLQQELETTKTAVQNTRAEEERSALHDQISHLQQENAKLNETIAELHDKNAKQISEIDDLKEKQQKMKILLARLKKDLQEKTQQQPKQSLIDLELADYEKTIKSLKEDLTQKDKEIQDLRDELTNLNEKSLSLKQEMESLEQQKQQTEERANKLKTLLDTTKKELLDAKDLEQERHQNEDNVRTFIDKLQSELDDHKVTVGQLMVDKQQLTERLSNQNETMQRTINLLEQNLRITKHDLDVAKQDYDTLKDEFNNYQIRAKSVLKQQQSTQRERLPVAVDKQAELEETIEKLKATLQDAHEKIQLLRSENDVLQREQDRLSEMQGRAISDAKKREQELRKQHQAELERMESECLKRTNESHDMMKDVTLQNETLSAAFKEQISAIEVDHARSISIVQNQLQASKQEIEQLKSRIESLRQTSVENDKEPAQVVVPSDTIREDLPWTFAERQQGEGSESANGEHPSSDIAVKTLENVLFGSSANNNRSPLVANADKPRHVLFEDAEVERQRLEEELNKTKYRLLNTTELLNESELNNVRLGEQVALLKEEIRRMERNMDRAESISNLEYLKNIILKFFILKSTYERLQLIPVLVTMLKLSPDEQAKLVRVAQQTSSIDDSSANNASTGAQDGTANAGASTWGSYLNIW